MTRGVPVVATTRHPEALKCLRELGATVLRADAESGAGLRDLREHVEAGCRVVHSVPTLRTASGALDPTPRLLDALGDRPVRMLYISTTGVYGRAREVDETTPVDPQTERERLRIRAEEAVIAGPWSALVLRPAAIYGPGRGVHVSMQQGEYKLVGDGGNFVSRIHVEDLAMHVVSGLLSDVAGAFPVADEEPCRSREIAEFCARLLGLPMPGSIEPALAGETRRSDRRVDGRAIRRLLGIELKYPSYKSGIPAALAC